MSRKCGGHALWQRTTKDKMPQQYINEIKILQAPKEPVQPHVPQERPLLWTHRASNNLETQTFFFKSLSNHKCYKNTCVLVLQALCSLFPSQSTLNQVRLLHIAQAIVLTSHLLAQSLASWLGMLNKWDWHFLRIQSTCRMYSFNPLDNTWMNVTSFTCINTGECIYKTERWCETVCAACHHSWMEILLTDCLKCLTCCAVFYRIGNFVFTFMTAVMIANGNDSKAENSNQGGAHYCCPADWGLQMLLSQLQLSITFKVHAEAEK